jgi:nucleoside-diphosphate-sugar epimerase
MIYFVTGATGFVGGVVARMLREQGHDVRAVVRNPDKAKALTALGVSLHKGDVTDRESMRSAMTGVDGVYHIAGWYKIGTKDKAEGVKINVDGTRNVLSLMQELGIPKGVYTSTLAVNSDTRGVEVDETYRFSGRHISVYDQTKADAHKIAEDFIAQGLPLVIVQPGLIYGPGDGGPSHDTWVQYLKRSLPMLVQKSAYSWAHIDDIAQAHLLAMAKGRSGQSYNINGPTVSLVDAMALAEQITGVPAPRLVMPPGMVKATALLTDVLDDFLPLPTLYTGEFLRVSAGVTYIGNNTKARAELGYAPRSLADGLPETLHWEMKQLGMQPKAA